MQDVLLDNNNDLRIEDGDFVTGESSQQHQELLLVTAKGEFKENPDATVGIENFINDSENDELVFEVKKCFENDGMRVDKIEFDETNNELNYDANYNS